MSIGVLHVAICVSLSEFVDGLGPVVHPGLSQLVNDRVCDYVKVSAKHSGLPYVHFLKKGFTLVLVRSQCCS